LLAVDRETHLGSARKTLDPHAGEHRTLRRRGEELVRRRLQGLLPETGAVLQPEAEAARRAEALDRRWRQGEAHGVLQAEQLPVRPGRDRRRAVVLVPLVPILQGDEGEGRILTDAREAETENGDD